MQEDRFRLETSDGRGMLSSLGRHANAREQDVERLVAARIPVRVTYTGEPDVGAIAMRLERIGERLGRAPRTAS